MKMGFGERFKGTKERVKKFVEDESGAGAEPSLQSLRSILQATVLGASLLGGVQAAEAKGLEHRPAITHQIPKNTSPEHDFVQPYVERAIEKHEFTKPDIDLLTLNLYFEARGESLEGQMAAVLVPLIRVAADLDKWGHGLHGVIYKKNQFSWTRDKHNTFVSVDKERKFQELHEMLTELFLGKPIGHVMLALAQFTHLPLDAAYYKRTDVHNADFDSLTQVDTIGAHTFYADRTHQQLPHHHAESIAPVQAPEAHVPLPHERPKKHLQKEALE